MTQDQLLSLHIKAARQSSFKMKKARSRLASSVDVVVAKDKDDFAPCDAELIVQQIWEQEIARSNLKPKPDIPSFSKNFDREALRKIS